MKKFLFSAILAVLSISCATAQYSSEYSSYDNDDYDYNVTVDDDLILTDRQWHIDNASILEANDYQYLVLRGGERYRYTLRPFDAYLYQNTWGDRVIEYRPYYYNGSLGWYVVGSLLNYFIYPDGRWCRFGYRPVYYDYHYPVYHSHCLNLFHWHFWTGRHHHHYRGHCYTPPRRRAPVHYRNGRNSYTSRSSGIRTRSNGYSGSRNSSGVSRATGSTVRSSRAGNSSRQSSVNTVSRQTSRSGSYSSGGSSRSSNSGYSRSVTRSRPESNYSRPSRSSGNSYRSVSGSGRNSSVSRRSR